MEGVEEWARARLSQLQRTWEDTQRNNHPDAGHILNTISDLKGQIGDEEFLINTSGYPDLPPP